MKRRTFLITASTTVAVGAVAGKSVAFAEQCPTCACLSRYGWLDKMSDFGKDYCRNCGALIANGNIDVKIAAASANLGELFVPFPDHRYIDGSNKPELCIDKLNF